MMAPIRVALIGLSATSTTSWASAAHLPYLLSPLGRSKYRIVALCNSSVSAAEAAVKAYNLPPTTHAYGDPDSLAADPEVDLVVCCTRVDTHFKLTKPSIEAGKNVYVEWPLAGNMTDVREMVSMTKQKGVRSMVGLQGQRAAILETLKDNLKSGGLGKVLSSEVRAAGGTVDRVTLSKGLDYFTQLKVGGNVFMIGFAHLFDLVQSVLGEAHDLKAHLQLQRPDVRLRDPATNDIVGTVASDVPDLIYCTGYLKESQFTTEGATVAVRFRRGQPFKGEPPLQWYINCENGEIRIIARGGSTLHANSYSEPVTIEVHNFETDEIRTLAWDWYPWQEEAALPIVSRSVGALYEAFAEGENGIYPSFEDGLRRHEQLHDMLSGWTAAQN